MPKREGPLWDAMEAAGELLDINREGAMSGKAYNADVTPIINLAKNIVEQCAKIAEKHGWEVCHGDGGIIADQIAEEIRKLVE